MRRASASASAGGAPSFPTRAGHDDLDTLLARDDLDVVDVLVPTPLHGDIGARVVAAGHHMQIQKPITRSLEDCDRLLAAADAQGAMVRVLEDYVFFPPLVRLREIVRSGELGEPVGLHMKVVNTGRGRLGRTPLGLQLAARADQRRPGHAGVRPRLAPAGGRQWLFGPIRSIVGWIGETEVAPGFVLDAPATLAWEHATGLRATLDITLAIDTYWRSDFYSCDERIEVTCARGSVRCNRDLGGRHAGAVARGVQDGEVRSFHTLDDQRRRRLSASIEHFVDVIRGRTTDVVMSGADARTVLVALLAALDSSQDGVHLRHRSDLPTKE